MPKLSEVLESILGNKSNFLKATDGKGFEERIISHLRTKGFDRALKEEDDTLSLYLDKIKPLVLDPLGTSKIINELATIDKQYINRFVYQPYGSQNFPDILVFTKDAIIPIEDKFSSSRTPKPVWNGNLPKANAIYIFGCYGLQDLTIFRGDDVLSEDERKQLVEFFVSAKTLEKDFKKFLKSELIDDKVLLKRGFNVSVRKAFVQEKKTNPSAETNYFTAKDRPDCELRAIEYIKSIE